jgi:hypothetical protein
MAEVLREFDATLTDSCGVRYHAHACGAPGRQGLWDGWIEFIPLDGGWPIRSGRETTQPNRDDATYWANGLSEVYLEGAFRRALEPVVVARIRRDRPVYEGPAPSGDGQIVHACRAVLDPFAAYRSGETHLRKQLGALSAWHLVGIIRAYDLADPPEPLLDRLPSPALVELIVSAVKKGGRSGAHAQTG